MKTRDAQHLIRTVVLLGVGGLCACGEHPRQAVCGDGLVEGREHCDHGSALDPFVMGPCTVECTWQEFSPPAAGSASVPAVAMNAAGDFVLAWQAEDLSGASRVWVATYAASGALTTGPYLVDGQSGEQERHPTVGMDGEGRFHVAWQTEPRSPGAGRETVWMRAFDLTGETLLAVTSLSAFPHGTQRRPRLAANEEGRVVVAWTSDGQDGDLTGVYATTGAVGGPLDIEEPFQVNTEAENAQENPAVALAEDGQFVVTWESRGQGTT